MDSYRQGRIRIKVGSDPIQKKKLLKNGTEQESFGYTTLVPNREFQKVNQLWSFFSILPTSLESGEDGNVACRHLLHLPVVVSEGDQQPAKLLREPAVQVVHARLRDTGTQKKEQQRNNEKNQTESEKLVI
jgi:hypothetical protein